jgi:hypothetical protein
MLTDTDYTEIVNPTIIPSRPRLNEIVASTCVCSIDSKYQHLLFDITLLPAGGYSKYGNEIYLYNVLSEISDIM